MTLAELFPRWHQLSGHPAEVWQTACKITDQSQILAILNLIADDQNRQLGEPGYFDLCEAIAADALALQQALGDGEDPTGLQFLQFEVALSPLCNAQLQGNFGLVHDWIMNGLSSDVGHAVERVVNIDRLDRFLASPDGWICDRRGETITDWAATFFYYCRVRGTLYEAANAMIGPALAAITSRPLRNLEVINALGMILNWTVQYRHPLAKPLTHLLLPLFEDGEPVAQRTRVAAIFASGAGEHSQQPCRYWADWALTNGTKHLIPHERFQLIWLQIETDEDWDRIKPLALAAISDYAAQFRALGSPTEVMRVTDQRAGLLKSAFLIMQRFGRSADLLEILAAWYGIPDDGRLKKGVLFVCPSFERGTIYLGRRAQLIERDGGEQLLELTRAANLMLGLTLTIQGHANDAELFGAPNRIDPGAAPEFEAAVERAYALDDVAEDVLAECRSMVLFPGQPHPVQALMQRHWGWSLPIAASLQEPLRDRPIKTALLWGSGCDFYSAFELDAIEVVFAAAGITVVRRSGVDATRDDFLAAYSTPEFDLIWVAGHGEINHWQDGSAQLLAGPDYAIGIDDLCAAGPIDGERRLCFLNVCDGGVSAVNGGIHKLGMAPMLAGKRQATISHIWPVNPLIASAFGVLLAEALVGSGSYHAAFDEALASLRMPLPDIASAVRAIVPGQQLVDRLENAGDLDTASVLHWGSPAFIQ